MTIVSRSKTPAWFLWVVALFLTVTSVGAWELMLGQAAPIDIKEGIKQVIDLIMLFGFVMGVAMIIRGAWENRNGQDGKASIISGALIAGAVAIMTFLYKAFGMGAGSMPF